MPGRSIGQTSPDTTTVAKAANDFALDLYGRLRSQPGNLFLSPYSVDTALAMVYGGAGGDTAAAMAGTLHLPAMKPDAFHQAMGGLMRKYQADKADQGYELHVANAIWVQEGFPLLPGYLDLVQHQYLARLSSLDFADSAGSAKTINDWVSQKTNDRIKNLISPDALGRLTRLVLTNAIYFKGTWETPFKPDATIDAPWHGLPDADASVSMMHDGGTYDYFENDSLSALELPYAGNALSMLVLLPKTIDGLADLESSLTAGRLGEIVEGLNKQEVQAALPKFKAESEFDLRDALSAMGMSRAFTSAADFSGIDGRSDLLISDVMHKAFVQVDEQGTEAAGATGIVMGLAAVRRPTIFNADHPFLYVIRDRQDQTILFIGRLTKP